MTEEPYRWLEAIGNRREYVLDQLKGGSPVFAISLKEGIFLFAVGNGDSKVFEIFDRQAMGALGHPADIEKARQFSIDSAHLEAFSHAPEDVSIRRLASFGLGPDLKNRYEQIFSPPPLLELVMVEVHSEPDQDVLCRLHFDGSFTVQTEGIAIVADSNEEELEMTRWLKTSLPETEDRMLIAKQFLMASWCILENKKWDNSWLEAHKDTPSTSEILHGHQIEAAWLSRHGKQQARYVKLSQSDLGL